MSAEMKTLAEGQKVLVEELDKQKKVNQELQAEFERIKKAISEDKK